MAAPRYVPSHMRSTESVAHEIEREPLGDRRAEVDWRREFDETEARRIKSGILARTPDDRWEAVYVETTSALTLYRSVSGTCMFVIELVETEGGCRVGSVWMNTNASQMRANPVEAVGIVERLVSSLADGSAQAERQRAVEDVEETPAARSGRFARAESEDEDASSADRLLSSIQSRPAVGG